MSCVMNTIVASVFACTSRSWSCRDDGLRRLDLAGLELVKLVRERNLDDLHAVIVGRTTGRKVLSARTHDMHFDYASTFVEIEPGARGGI